MKPKSVKQKKATAFGFTEEQIKSLNRLNALLAQREEGLFERYRNTFNMYSNRLIHRGGDLNSFEIDVIIEFQASADFYPKYFFNVRAYKDFTEDVRHAFALEKKRVKERHPEVDTNWCYLMHRLYEQAHGTKSLYKIVEVAFGIVIREQQYVRVVGHEIFY